MATAQLLFRPELVAVGGAQSLVARKPAFGASLKWQPVVRAPIYRRSFARAAKPADEGPSAEELVKGDVAQWEQRQGKAAYTGKVGAENVGANQSHPAIDPGTKTFYPHAGKTDDVSSTPSQPLEKPIMPGYIKYSEAVATASETVSQTPSSSAAYTGRSRHEANAGSKPLTPDTTLKRGANEAYYGAQDASHRAQGAAKETGRKVEGAAKDFANKAEDAGKEAGARVGRATERAGEATKRAAGVNIAQAHSTEAKKKGAVIHDFCLGFPYGAFLLAGSIAWYAMKGRAGAMIGIVAGIAQLAFSWLSLRTWKMGYSPVGYTIPQAAIAGYFAWREGTQFFQGPAPFVPSGLLFFVSAAMAAFFLYVQLSGGNPQKKTSAA